MKRSLSFIGFILMMTGTAPAQDSQTTLSWQQVLNEVKKNHPVALQAGILVDKARADITIAQSAFDPFFNTNRGEKTFNHLEYYNYQKNELYIPTLPGVDMYAGLENLNGQRTNPGDTRGKTGFVGVSIPLAQNVLTDKRRAALRTAYLMREASESEKALIYNNLILDAMKAYWTWALEYSLYKTYDQVVQVNLQRFDFIKKTVLLGDRPAIDTIEALTQLQSFIALRENAWLRFRNAGLELSVFLWDENQNPVTLSPTHIPLPLWSGVTDEIIPDLQDLLSRALAAHPELRLVDYKLKALDIERKLMLQQLLPDIRFNYQHITEGYRIFNKNAFPLFENNFRYQLRFAVPLRLSYGRGEYRKTKLKISETRLEQSLKRLKIENTVRKYYNEVITLRELITLQQKIYENFLAMLRAEETRFRLGDSSLFLINARESKVLEALLKLQELQAKYKIALNELTWAAGLLGN
ncbi:MAG: TolC family protein [Chitinophagaceae bacterium]|nr:TolC family protein [Chitinophagaceae bacterium]